MKRWMLVVVVSLYAGVVVAEPVTNSLQVRLEQLESAVAELEMGTEELVMQPKKRFTLHTYAELHYNMTDKAGGSDKMDMHRAAIGFGYALTDKLLFEIEIDFEHAATEIELEFAQLSYTLSENLGLRIGCMLMPVGFLNVMHEPILFYSVERPYFNKYVIPTTWQEGGAGIYGTIFENLDYTFYLVSTLDAEGFSGSSGIRGGRGRVADAVSEHLAGVGRLLYNPLEGLSLGVSGYYGNSGQTDDISDVPTQMLQADVRYRRQWLELRGNVASVQISNTKQLNDRSENEDVIGKQIFGWYLEGAVHTGEWILPEDQDLIFFARYDTFNTQYSVADGYDADPANDRTVVVTGLAYAPIPQVMLKIDMEFWENDAGEDWYATNLGMAVTF